MSDWDSEYDSDLSDDDAGWSEGLDDSDDAAETVPCPACGTDVYEEADQCPACGEYVVLADSAWGGKPVWWVLAGLAGIVAVIVTLLGFVL